jgi:hypothetical protein
MTGSAIDRIVTQRVVHQLVTERLIERVFNRPLIGNVERGAYVECMIELALSDARPPWSLTDTWAAWDLRQDETSARIEVKQSAALQTWTTVTAGTSPPTFDIAPRTGYYKEDGADWFQPPTPARFSDIYVMAWHGERNPRVADHRRPDQWQFFVVPEHRLRRGQKSISLSPLARLNPPVAFDELAAALADTLRTLPNLKADIERAR